MNYHVEKCHAKPAYFQLYELLKKDIIAGVYPYGAKLPSKRTMSADLGLSVVPIEHALALLCEEGYAVARERSGYFVIYQESDFSCCTPPFSFAVAHGHVRPVKSQFPFSVLAKTMRRVLLDYHDRLLVKSPNHGTAELRLAISLYLVRSSGISVLPEQIIIGSGAEYLYSLIVQLLGKERVFALENPSYEKIRRVYEANGVRCDMLKLGHDGIRSSELQGSNASVLHITPFHSFPSGITASVSKRNEYIQWAKSRNGYIIEDNYDSELTVSKKNEDSVFSLSRQESVIYLNTFSKTVAPSIRVGYMVLPENLRGEFENKLGFYSCTVPVFEQYVLAELIRNGDFERNINRIRRLRRKQK